MAAQDRFIWYAVSDNGDHRFKMPWPYSFSAVEKLEIAAADAAEDYHSRHDGFESRWPLDFTIFESEDGPGVGCCEVEREHVPEFRAYQKEVR